MRRGGCGSIRGLNATGPVASYSSYSAFSGSALSVPAASIASPAA
jgi:hypothetical protein